MGPERRVVISIHAPRMGSDNNGILHIAPDNHFNPRPPHGKRQLIHAVSKWKRVFQSTPPHGERHSSSRDICSFVYISIHAPAWGATFFFACSECFFNISIHTPRMGSDHPYLHVDQVQHISIHAPRMGSDDRRFCRDFPIFISIHAPRMGSDP